MTNKVLGSGVVANAGRTAGRDFSVEAPKSDFLCTRLTVQPEGSALRWSVDGDAGRGAKIGDGEERVFEGAELIQRLRFRFPKSAAGATAHVLFESDGAMDLSWLNESARRRSRMTEDEMRGFASLARSVGQTGNKPRGPEAVLNFQSFRRTPEGPGPKVGPGGTTAVVGAKEPQPFFEQRWSAPVEAKLSPPRPRAPKPAEPGEL